MLHRSTRFNCVGQGGCTELWCLVRIWSPTRVRARHRPREFQNLKPRLPQCNLYFCHTFLCHGFGGRYGLMLEGGGCESDGLSGRRKEEPFKINGLLGSNRKSRALAKKPSCACFSPLNLAQTHTQTPQLEGSELYTQYLSTYFLPEDTSGVVSSHPPRLAKILRFWFNQKLLKKSYGSLSSRRRQN